LPVAVLAAAFLLRLFPAAFTFLNPDEALHYWLSLQPSPAEAYKAAMTQAHPPLLIMLLYYWGKLGHSELMLRLPSLLTGTAFCWMTFLWLGRIMDRSSALTGLLLAGLAPSLVFVSAEVRQYGLLLFFISACLYLAERAVQDNSRLHMVLFSISLYGALLSHYSGFLFAFVMGVYVLARLYPYRGQLAVTVVWGVGQIIALCIVLFFIGHIGRESAGGLANVMDSWLHKSFFHSSETSLTTYVAVQSLRVFTYLFGQGVIGALAFICFLIGMGMLIRRPQPFCPSGPSPKLLAGMIMLPFLMNCLLGILGKYPYAGTRHGAFLSPFAIAGICVALAGWTPSRSWLKPAVLVIGMAICNLFPAPGPPIRVRNQSKARVASAVELLHSTPDGAVILADTQSALLLGYYVCGHPVMQIFNPDPFPESSCGRGQAIVSRNAWMFDKDNLGVELRRMTDQHDLQQARIWLFRAGWIVSAAPQMRTTLQKYGCGSPQQFGDNVSICEITLRNIRNEGVPVSSLR
jgi:hypothetical protein